MKIAILGWGSLLWDKRPQFECFNSCHGEWLFDGPELWLEFSRVSETRKKALTLVLDKLRGRLCRVAYAASKRPRLDDAIEDLRCREGTCRSRVGVWSAGDTQDYSDGRSITAMIASWANAKRIESVVWTNLESNFEKHGDTDMWPAGALQHLQQLPQEDKVQAFEYIRNAPCFVQTPLRDALQRAPWF